VVLAGVFFAADFFAAGFATGFRAVVFLDAFVFAFVFFTAIGLPYHILDARRARRGGCSRSSTCERRFRSTRDTRRCYQRPLFA
jgi:hypothetical protein